MNSCPHGVSAEICAVCVKASFKAREKALWGPLRRRLDASGLKLDDATVLAVPNDPYRLDTAKGHDNAEWFQTQFDACGRSSIHLRGLHYTIVVRGDVLKPNGHPYRNTEKDWLWLQRDAAKAARWLGYVDFDRIFDQRAGEPVVRRSR